MHLYLDVNGVLVDRENRPAPGVAEFLEWATTHHDCYWLTTHCKGSAKTVLDFLLPIMPATAVMPLQHIKPTNWDVRKTEAIDFSADFRWLDDYVMDAERKALREHDAEDKLIPIDLDARPDQLLELISGF